TYSATGLPPSLTVNAATGLISGTISLTSAGTYSVTATASDGSLSNSKTFTWTVLVTPNITSLSPTRVKVGLSVTVLGTNFSATKGTSAVTFNGTAGTPTSWSATSIGVPVPSGATSGYFVMTVGG